MGSVVVRCYMCILQDEWCNIWYDIDAVCLHFWQSEDKFCLDLFSSLNFCIMLNAYCLVAKYILITVKVCNCGEIEWLKYRFFLLFFKLILLPYPYLNKITLGCFKID